MLGARGRGVDGQTCMHDVWGGGGRRGRRNNLLRSTPRFPLKRSMLGVGGGGERLFRVARNQFHAKRNKKIFIFEIMFLLS